MVASCTRGQDRLLAKSNRLLLLLLHHLIRLDPGDLLRVLLLLLESELVIEGSSFGTLRTHSRHLHLLLLKGRSGGSELHVATEVVELLLVLQVVRVHHVRGFLVLVHAARRLSSDAASKGIDLVIFIVLIVLVVVIGSLILAEAVVFVVFVLNLVLVVFVVVLDALVV